MSINKIVWILRDIVKAFVIGLVAGLVIAVVLFVVGLIYGSGSLASGLEVAKDGLFLTGALGLFVLAGLLLVKGKKPEKDMADNGWRRHFRVIGVKVVVGMICVGVLLVAASVDYLQSYVSSLF
jgi:hypothetical protein